MKRLSLSLPILLGFVSGCGSHSTEPPSPLEPYVGDWTGVGWGWEVRFKQSRKAFVAQFNGGQEIPGQTGEETIMSLMVKHAVEFAITVAPDGSATGKGVIVYDLFPNLCGVAALTKQVNEAVNLMDKIPFIFQLSTELGKGASANFRADWQEKENNLANSLAGWRLDSPEGLASCMTSAEKTAMPAMHIGAWMRENEPDEVVSLAKAIIRNRCSRGNYTFLSGFNCGLLEVTPIAQDSEQMMSLVFDGAVGTAWELLGDSMVKKMKALSLESQRDEARCRLGAAAGARAGTSLGPATGREFIYDIAPDAAKALLDVATGGAPVSLMLSIPGVTQVQYEYKGLPNGPEERTFDIKGRLVPTGDGARLELAMDGEVDGDNQLYDEFTVNYQPERYAFPTWSPFRNVGGPVKRSGTLTTYDHTQIMQQRTFEDAATGKTVNVDVPTDVTTQRTFEASAPFATFSEKGSHRDGTEVWQDYEYFWSAVKVTGVR